MIFVNDDNLDSDTIAVLRREDISVRFVTTNRDAIDGENFSIVLWDEDNVVLAISEDFLMDDVERYVSSLVAERMIDDGEFDSELFYKTGIEVFGATLSAILSKALERIDDPNSFNLEASINKFFM